MKADYHRESFVGVVQVEGRPLDHTAVAQILRSAPIESLMRTVNCNPVFVDSQLAAHHLGAQRHTDPPEPRTTFFPCARDARQLQRPILLSHDVYFTLEDWSPKGVQSRLAACRKHLTGHPGTVFFAAGTLEAELRRVAPAGWAAGRPSERDLRWVIERTIVEDGVRLCQSYSLVFVCDLGDLRISHDNKDTSVTGVELPMTLPTYAKVSRATLERQGGPGALGDWVRQVMERYKPDLSRAP